MNSTTPDHDRPVARVQFNLRTLLVMTSLAALLCAPLAYWGWQGVSTSILLLAIVVAVAMHLRGWTSIVNILAVFIVLGMIAAMMLPAINGGGASPRSSCINNVKQLALAMHLYHDQHGHFPPAYVADADGRPLHSWRVLLLPYLEERKKFNAYRWDEPWNGPNNSKLADCPDIFQCPGDPALANSPMTSYVVVTGHNTPFSGDLSTNFSDFASDGTAKSILIVEVANSGIHWMEPRDLNLQQMATTINAAAGQGISSEHKTGAVVAYADNHVEFLPATICAEQLRARLTIDGSGPPVVDEN